MGKRIADEVWRWFGLMEKVIFETSENILRMSEVDWDKGENVIKRNICVGGVLVWRIVWVCKWELRELHRPHLKGEDILGICD